MEPSPESCEVAMFFDSSVWPGGNSDESESVSVRESRVVVVVEVTARSSNTEDEKERLVIVGVSLYLTLAQHDRSINSLIQTYPR